LSKFGVVIPYFDATMLYIDLCISVDDAISMREAHEIASNVEVELINKISFVKEANVIVA